MLLKSSSRRKLRSSRRPEALKKNKNTDQAAHVNLGNFHYFIFASQLCSQHPHLPILAFDLKQSRHVSYAATPWQVQAQNKVMDNINIDLS